MLKFLYKDIVYKEVPNEVSLCFSFTGCPLKCKGCHSPELRDDSLGEFLTIDKLKAYLEEYKDFITCVLFFGGDWDTLSLNQYCFFIKKNYPKLKICLYTGYSKVDGSLIPLLDYLKVGPYVDKLGGLESPKTNQKFYDLKNKKDLTHLFHNDNKI